jgi:molybdate transport system substrate-binding protein
MTVCAAVVLSSAPLPPHADAGEIKVLSATGIREAIEDLAPKFERATGHKVVVAFANSGTVLKRFAEGESADVILLPREAIDGLVKDGKANANSVAIVARAGIGVAIRKGAIKPDIATADGFKRALLTAKSITYLDPAGGGVSGVHISKVLDRLDIANEINAKTVFHRNAAEAAALIVDGKAEIGMNLIPELTPISGIDIIGPLPGDLQLTNVYAVVITSNAKEPTASKAFSDFLRSPEAAIVVKAKGMEPG